MLASDAFFPFSWGDSVERACQAGVKVRTVSWDASKLTQYFARAALPPSRRKPHACYAEALRRTLLSAMSVHKCHVSLGGTLIPTAPSVQAIAHPGGSLRDQDAVDCCNKYGVALVTTAVRHFRH